MTIEEKQKAEQTCRNKMLADPVYTLNMIKELTGFTRRDTFHQKGHEAINGGCIKSLNCSFCF